MERRVLRIIKQAMDEIAPMVSTTYEFKNDLQLTGRNGILDSLALVSLISELEDGLSEEFGKEVQLVTDKAFAKGNSPFYSVEMLCQFILALLQ